MAGFLASLSLWMIISVHATFLVLAQDGDQFVYYDFKNSSLYVDGMANTDDDLLHLTNNTGYSTGHAFHKSPMKFTTSSSFSTEFVFAIIPLQRPPSYGQGMAFVVAPTTHLSSYGTANENLGIFNRTIDGKNETHILAIELDTNKGSDDNIDNHVGIDINSIVSVESTNASYMDAEGKNITLLLASGKSTLIWIDYDGIEQRLNVTLAPVPTPKPVSPLFSSSIKPSVPLLTRSINLSEIFNQTMFVGFSGSTGSTRSDQYILGWSFKKGGGKAVSLDLSKILDPPKRPPPPSSIPPPSPASPPPPSPRKEDVKKKIILGTTISSIAFLMILGGMLYLYLKKKYAEVLEQWEKEYSPQSFSFGNLYF